MSDYIPNFQIVTPKRSYGNSQAGEREFSGPKEYREEDVLRWENEPHLASPDALASIFKIISQLQAQINRVRENAQPWAGAGAGSAHDNALITNLQERITRLQQICRRLEQNHPSQQVH